MDRDYFKEQMEKSKNRVHISPVKTDHVYQSPAPKLKDPPRNINLSNEPQKSLYHGPTIVAFMQALEGAKAKLLMGRGAGGQLYRAGIDDIVNEMKIVAEKMK